MTNPRPSNGAGSITRYREAVARQPRAVSQCRILQLNDIADPIYVLPAARIGQTAFQVMLQG
jgi:hypothetical protein